MKNNVALTVASLLSILFFTFHLADDIVRGFEPGGFKNIVGVLTLVVWLYGTLVLAERRSGYVIILLGSLLGALMPLAHMRGSGLVGGRIANSSGVLFWVWTLMALGVTATFSVILSARGLWGLQWRLRGADVIAALGKAGFPFSASKAAITFSVTKTAGAQLCPYTPARPSAPVCFA